MHHNNINVNKDCSRRLLKKRTIPIGPSFMKDSPQKIGNKMQEELLINNSGDRSPSKIQMASPINLGTPQFFQFYQQNLNTTQFNSIQQNNFYLRRESSSIFRTPSRQQLQAMRSESRLDHDPSTTEFPFIEEPCTLQDGRVTPAKSRLIYNSNGDYIDLTGNLVGDGALLNQTALTNSSGKQMYGMIAFRTVNQPTAAATTTAPNSGSSPLPPCSFNNNRF